MNFKQETIEAIKESGHELEDVMFIGDITGKYRISMDKFLGISDFEYDDHYGSQKIANISILTI